MSPLKSHKPDGTASSRLKGRTEKIDLGRLERENRKYIWLGFVVSVVIHFLTAAFFVTYTPEKTVSKPVTVELIIKPPRLTKPFVLRKKKTGKRMLTPEIPVRVPDLPDIPERFDRQISMMTPARPESIDIDTEISSADFHDTGETRNIEPSQPPSRTRPPGRHDIEDEILSVEDLDYGRYKSLVIRDLLNRKNITGFIYIPVSIWSAELTPLERPVIGLAEALKKYTGITPKLDKRLYIDSREIHKYPFLYISTDQEFGLTDAEHRNFTGYLRNGGFAVLDNGFPQDKNSDAEASLRKMLFDVKTEIGSSAYITIIPPYHPLYHSFFDFDYGPPLGAELIPSVEFNPTKDVIDREYHPDPFLEGLWIGPRLAAVYSDKGYGLRWTQIADNEPQQKIGVNFVVYSLIHEGGINRRQTPSVAALR